MEPVLLLEGLLMGEDDEPGALLASSTFLEQAPSDNAAAKAKAVAAADWNLERYMSVSFTKYRRWIEVSTVRQPSA